MSEPVRILEWYRPDTSVRVRRILIIAPALMSLSGVVIGLSFLTHQPEQVRTGAAAIGFVMVAGSAIFTAGAMHRILRDDGSLTLRTDGVSVQSSGRETLVAWADLESARWDSTRGVLVLERRGSESVLVAWSPARVSGPELAERIEHDRRKAAMGLLR